MSEIDDLRNELQALKTQVSTVSRRLTELDSSMSDHIGLDWGETLTDANSPHPNISVNTIESGGGAIRQDQYGMQVKTNGTQRGGIFFVDELETDPNQADPMQVGIYGYSNDDTLNAHVEMGLVNSSPSSATIVNAEVYAENLGDNTGRVGMVVDLEGTDTPGDEWAEVTLTRTWNRDAGRFQLYQALLGLHPGDGAGFSMGDPANAIEGDIWYNTTDNQFKFYEGSTIKTLGGGGMSVKVKEADETLSSNNTLQNDDELFFAVAANEVWQFEGSMFIDTISSADFRFAVTGPSGAVGRVFAAYSDTAAFDAHVGAGDLGDTIDLQTANTGTLVRFWGGIHNGANAGNLQVQWAQRVSQGTATTVHAGSYIKYQQANV